MQLKNAMILFYDSIKLICARCQGYQVAMGLAKHQNEFKGDDSVDLTPGRERSIELGFNTSEQGWDSEP